MLLQTMVEHSRRKKICIKWQKLTRLSLTTNSNNIKTFAKRKRFNKLFENSNCIKTPNRCNKSLKYTVKLEKIKAIPIDTIYCIAKIRKYHNQFIFIPRPLTKTNITIIIVEIKKFIASLVTTDIGNISLGKYTFLIIFPLSIITPAPLITTLLKYCQGIKAQHKYTA